MMHIAQIMSKNIRYIVQIQTIHDNIEIVYMFEENVVVPKITKTYHNKFSKSLDVPNVWKRQVTETLQFLENTNHWTQQHCESFKVK